jgi:ribonuclease-3
VSADPRRLAAVLLGDGATLRSDLLTQALTHRSAGPTNNERLEFLGDALLGLVIAETLWERFPDADEGELSRRRAALVNKESLAALSRELGVGDYLKLGSGELRSGGFARDSILADALEALLGAVYVDKGFEQSRAMVLRLFERPLQQIARGDAIKDPKTRLQELLQAARRPLPSYEVVDISGSQHAQSFVVRCRLEHDHREVEGKGTSRRRAEQAAAEEMLNQLSEETGR